MNGEEKQGGFHWRVAQFILYLVNVGNDTFYVYHVPLSDAGGCRIDLDLDVLPKEELSDSGTYPREEVVRIASLAGHSTEQIDAALLLVDTGDTVDQHDMARMGDEAYEELIRAAKKRLIYFRRAAQSPKSVSHGNIPDT